MSEVIAVPAWLRRSLLAAVIAALAVGGAYAAWARSRPPAAPPRARLVREPLGPGAVAGKKTVREDAQVSVVKVLELVGQSDKGWEDAARNALREAARTVHGITGVEVLNWTADVRDGSVVDYKANVKVAFVVDR